MRARRRSLSLLNASASSRYSSSLPR
uniref:Uncharacterized protein n=1 Tax=Triticum urartu TaxID=4572 RepID=A0A8R7QK89_TRIUA